MRNLFFDKSMTLVNQGYAILLKDIGKGEIKPENRYYMLKELARHKKNINNGNRLGCFKPDIQALLQVYNTK